MSFIEKGTFSSSRYGFSTRVLIMAAVTFVAARWLLPGVEVTSIFAAIVTAFVIAILDNIVRPILLVITLPLSIITSGLFVFIINTAVIMLANGLMGDKFTVHGWGWGLLFSLVLTAVDYLIELPSQRSQQQYDNIHHDQQNTDDDGYTPYEEVND